MSFRYYMPWKGPWFLIIDDLMENYFKYCNIGDKDGDIVGESGYEGGYAGDVSGGREGKCARLGVEDLEVVGGVFISALPHERQRGVEEDETH